WSRGDGPVLYTRIVRNGLGDPVLVRPPTTVYADSSVEAFRAYRYVLRSQNAVGISADSAVVTLVAGMPNAAPPQVTTDSARVIGQRLMVWGTVKSNVIPTRYSAEWKTVPEMTGIGRSKAGGVIEDTLLHHVAVALPVEAEGTYYARLSASNPMGSAQGQVRSAQLVRPSVPQDFDAFARADGTVEAGWTYDGPSVTSWRLLRRPLGTEAWTLARTGVGSTVRVLTDFAYDVNVDTWEWMVQACAGVLCTPSAVDQVSGLRLLPPEDLHTTSVAPGAVSLAWAPAGGPVVEQVVFRRASYGPVAQWQVPANAATFTDTTAQAGIQYHYFVWGRNRVGSSPPSAEVAVTP
ncbi:MAG TPA: fibronectin type III domain-containing protein, partial [Longimicrobium sp.]|nr:fibronectin type III domain-containing protein [Longimicrobium sp.]